MAVVDVRTCVRVDSALRATEACAAAKQVRRLCSEVREEQVQWVKGGMRHALCG